MPPGAGTHPFVTVVDCDDRHGAVRYRDQHRLETRLGRVRRDELAR